MTEIERCVVCGANLAMVGRSHRCVPRPQPPPPQGLRIASRLKPKPKNGEPIGDGVALTTIAHPPGLIDKMADAIKSGKLSLKKGRPRIGEERAKPWLQCKPPMSKTTWYRRQKEQKK